MNPAAGHFAGIGAIAKAVQAQLGLVMLPAVPPAPAVAAFQRVELFDSENLGDAFQQLLVSEQRIAIVVPLHGRWEDQFQQRKILTRRSVPVAVLISDRVIGSRTAALFGQAGPGANATPGAYALAALAVPFVTGQLISNPGGVIASPGSESVMILKSNEKQNLPGRAVVVLEIECHGGWMENALDPGPTL